MILSFFCEMWYLKLKLNVSSIVSLEHALELFAFVVSVSVLVYNLISKTSVSISSFIFLKIVSYCVSSED